MRSIKRIALGGAVLLATSAALPGVSHADTFLLTSCHITGSSCNPDDGGSGFVPDSAAFGTVTLTQVGTSVTFSVSLNNGNRFVETGAGGGEFFLFDDAIAGSTITNITTSPNTPAGGMSGFTNLPPVMADGTGNWSASVECTVAGDCSGGSTPTITSLAFTVTNATIAQLTSVGNDKGNIFAADILCGATQQFCPSGKTGPVDTPVPGPILGAGLPSLFLACAGLVGLARRRRQKIA